MKKFQLVFFSLFAALMVCSAIAHAECPLGEKETHLTIHRVMRNFGRFVTPADMVTIKGVNPNEKVNDQELTIAIEKLGYVVDCAQAVLDNPTGDMLPTDAHNIEDAKTRQEYVDDFLYFMTDFRDGLIEYREMFKKTLLQKPEERDYKPLREKCIELDNLVEHAHKKV
jgi:hypothetical protein